MNSSSFSNLRFSCRMPLKITSSYCSICQTKPRKFQKFQYSLGCQSDTFVVQKFPKGVEVQFLYHVVCSKCDKHYTQFKDTKCVTSYSPESIDMDYT